MKFIEELESNKTTVKKTLNNASIKEEDSQKFIAAAAKNTSVKALMLENFDDNNTQVVIEALKQNKVINAVGFKKMNPLLVIQNLPERINVIELQEISSDYIPAIMDELQKHSSVTRLVLHDMDSKSFEKLIEGLQDNKFITSFFFKTYNLDALVLFKNFFLSKEKEEIQIILGDEIAPEAIKQVDELFNKNNLKINGASAKVGDVIANAKKNKTSATKSDNNNNENHISKSKAAVKRKSADQDVTGDDRQKTNSKKAKIAIQKKIATTPKSKKRRKNHESDSDDNFIEESKQTIALEEHKKLLLKSKIIFAIQQKTTTFLQQKQQFMNEIIYTLFDIQFKLASKVPSRNELEPFLVNNLGNAQVVRTNSGEHNLLVQSPVKQNAPENGAINNKTEAQKTVIIPTKLQPIPIKATVQPSNSLQAPTVNKQNSGSPTGIVSPNPSIIISQIPKCNDPSHKHETNGKVISLNATQNFVEPHPNYEFIQQQLMQQKHPAQYLEQLQKLRQIQQIQQIQQQHYQQMKQQQVQNLPPQPATKGVMNVAPSPVPAKKVVTTPLPPRVGLTNFAATGNSNGFFTPKSGQNMQGISPTQALSPTPSRIQNAPSIANVQQFMQAQRQLTQVPISPMTINVAALANKVQQQMAQPAIMVNVSPLMYDDESSSDDSQYNSTP